MLSVQGRELNCGIEKQAPPVSDTFALGNVSVLAHQGPLSLTCPFFPPIYFLLQK